VGRAGAASVFGALLKSYQPSLAGRDESLMALAQRVGQLHFGWAPPQSPMQGLMDMFKA